MSLYLSFLGEDDICDYYSDDYDYDQCQILQNNCKTIEGTPCIFPFTFRSQQYTYCISGRKRKQPWCPTEVDSNGNPVPGQWGECNEQCPTEGADVGKSL